MNQLKHLLLVAICFSILPLTLSSQNGKDTLAFRLSKITASEFEEVRLEYRKILASKKVIQFDSLARIPELNVTLVSDCYEVCSDLLVNSSDSSFLNISANYDAGNLGIMFSPSDLLITYASYDGPDYYQYYDSRCEIYFYSVTRNKGVEGIKVLGAFFSEDWSLEDVVCGSSSFLVLKVYRGQGYGDRIDGEFEYYQLNYSEQRNQ